MNMFRIRELADKPDTLTLFSRLKALSGAFLLYSGTGYARERFDVFSALPHQVRTLATPPATQSLNDLTLDMMQVLQANPADACEIPLPGWYGVMSYDLSGGFAESKQGSTPVFHAGFYPVVFVVDRQLGKLLCAFLADYEPLAQTLIQAIQSPGSESKPFVLDQPFSANLSADQYGSLFSRVQDYLHAGDCYQVNLAQRFSAPYQGDSWPAYSMMASVLPAPMGCYFSGEGFSCLSFSPERFLAIRDGHVTTHPIKGTRPRFPDDIDKDQLQMQELRTSEKDQAENLMIVDLLRNDLGISCQPGSIQVTQLFGIETFANVHHMVSDIEGQLRPDIHPLQALFAAFPGGSITGAPKKRAMEIIAELEPDSRSFYCGCAFYCDISGRLDSNILIRTLVCHDGQIACWGGGGIVADSTAQAEYQETLDKVGIILRTLESTIDR